MYMLETVHARRCWGLQKALEKYRDYAQPPDVFLHDSYLEHGTSDFETRIDYVKKLLFSSVLKTTKWVKLAQTWECFTLV